MKVKVRLFAVARTTVGKSCVELQLPEGATVGQLRAKLAEDFPALDEVLRSALFAINAQYARDTAVISEDNEIACIPPVSGG